MAKNKTEIHVTTVFDGELDATDVFVSLISQKYGKTNTKEYLAKKRDMKYKIRFIGSLQLSYRRIGNEKVTVYFQHLALKYRISNN